HTQSCSWPTGALDNCYGTEGGCSTGPAPTSGGTVMSYCHLSSTGINFLNGFGTEPGNKMRAEVAAATCLGSTTPTAPTVVGGGATRDCPGPLTLTAANCTGTYNWYTTSGTGSSVFTGNPYNIPTVSASTIYYVTCTEGGCESGKVPVVAIVNPLPDVVTVTSATRCDVGSVTLTATGCNNTYNWYTAAVGGSIIGSGSSFVTPSLQATTTYYVNCTDGSCSIASRIPVTATISTLNSIICNTATISGTAGSSVFDLGLNNATGRLMAGNSKSYSTIGLSSFPVINYTDNTLTTCQVSAWGTSSAVLVPFRVSQSGNYQMSTSGQGYVTFSVFSSNTYDCSNFVGGNSFRAISWYGSRVINLSECTTYYALLYNLNNSNSSITLNFVGSGDVLEVVPNSAGQTYTYVAVNDISGKIDAISATSDFTTLEAGTYRVYGINYQTGLNTSSLLNQTITQARALGCMVFSANSRLLTVTCPITPPPTTAAGSNCGSGTVQLSASNCSGTVNWYGGSTGGISLATTANFTTPNLSTTTTYYVECTINGCTSSRSPVVATISTIPSAPTVNSPTVNSGQTATLTANGCSGTVNWFDIAAGGTSLGIGISLTTTPLSNPPSATYLYYSDCTEGNCTSNRSTATVTVNPNPCPSLSYNLVSPSDDVSGGTTIFEAGLEIKAANKLTGNSNVKYDSGKYVLLQPGFVTETGTIFEAYIDGCGNN
ncbi:MAG: hypothetical protein NWP83_05570, partial [Spirosomaceae bacterium]|nr:hypothetical protein [Spirosomataceae bacterium]